MNSANNYNRSIIHLYARFLKKMGDFNKLYMKRNIEFINSLFSCAYNFRLTDFSLDYTSKIVYGTDCDELGYHSESHKRMLQYSQLWRIFVYDNIESLDLESLELEKEDVISELLANIEANGTRGLKEVEDFFKKVNITKYKIT